MKQAHHSQYDSFSAFPLTKFFRFISAPFSNSSFTTSACPDSEALCKSVFLH